MINLNRIYKNIFILLSVVSVGCGGGGGGSGGGNGGDGQDTKIKNAVLENTTPIGISSFAMGVPNKFPFDDAQQTPEGIGFGAVSKVVRHIATNELYTFPERTNPAQVEMYLKNLVDAGHQVTHEIHILNGPAMRKSTDYFINDFYHSSIDDKTFVRDLNTNQALQDHVRNLFAEVVAHARVLEASGVEVLICPELEDNHPDDVEMKNGKLTSIGLLISFLTDLGWDRTRIVRNGGRLHAIADIRYESHNQSGSVAQLRPGDIYNNDGKDYSYDTQPQVGCKYSESDMRAIRDAGQNSGVIVFIWSAELQGLNYNSQCNGSAVPSLRNRNYIFEEPVRLASILLGIKPEEVNVGN